MRQSFFAKKEVFEAIPPFDRKRSIFQEVQIRGILEPARIVVSNSGDRQPNGTLFLDIPDSVFRALFEELDSAGVDRSMRSADKFPLFRVIPNHELKEFFGEHMVYGNMCDLPQHYFLEVLDRGEGDFYLMAKYQQIIGSRKLGKIPADLLETMKERFTALLREKLVVPANAPAAAPASIAADPELMEQISSLVPVSNRLELPDVNLSLYKDIKNVMLKAGGKYKSAGKELPAHFVFHASINTKALLDKIVGGEKVNIQKETQFFATPKKLARRLVDSLGPTFVVGAKVLEPSAGQAAIADEAKEMGASSVATIENWSINAEVLRSKGYDPIEKDFLEVRPEQTGLFHAVLMNPPFSGRQDIAHVRHALSFLNPDGRLGAITSRQYETSSVKDSQEFRTLLSIANAETQTIEQGAFKESGTTVSTSMITIDMELLLNRLQELGTDGSELGVDLSRQWLAREEQQAMRLSDAHRLSAARP
jgi:predicted RNA methylase